MIKFLLKRVFFQSLPTFFIIVSATFFMARFVPGGPFDKERATSGEVMEVLNAYYGLNDSLCMQYLKFWKNLFLGDLGPSYKYFGWSVNELIFEKALVSLELGMYALIFAIILGLVLGLFLSFRKESLSRELVEIVSMIGICLPSFLLGPILILIFAVRLKVLNAMGWNFSSDIILPTLTLGFFYSAWIARLTYKSVSEEILKPYVRTAKSKGLSGFRIVFYHIMRNALQPLVSYLGPAAAGLLTGSFVVETIFQIPGLGRFFISSALDNDYSMLVACVIVYSGFIIIFNIIADIILAFLNPRIGKEMR